MKANEPKIKIEVVCDNAKLDYCLKRYFFFRIKFNLLKKLADHIEKAMKRMGL